MTNEQPLEIRATPIVGGSETEGIVSIKHITAGDLTDVHVGRFLGCHGPERKVNYPAKILKVQRYEGGKAPGVSVGVRHSQILDRAASDERWHLPFDSEVELMDLAAL